jgi:translocation and assembly module TamB
VSSTAKTETNKDSSRQPVPSGKPRRRRSRIWRVIKWALLILLIVIVLLLGLVAWVFGTNSGTAFAWNQAKGYLPADIKVASVHGRLIGPLTVRGVEYKTDSMDVHVKSVDFDMAVSDLFSRTVHIQNLAVAGVDYEVTKVVPPKPKPKSNKPFSLPDAIHLPVTVQIDRVAVDNLKAVTSPKAKPVIINSARIIDARLANAQWKIKSITGHGPMFDIDANADLTPHSGYATNLQAAVALRLPDLAPIHVKADITGSLKNLNAKANVAAPYNVKLAAHLKDALSKPVVDAQLHVTDIHTRKIKKSLPKIAASANVFAKGPFDDLNLRLNSQLDSADYGKVNLDGQLAYTGKAVKIDHLNIVTPATNGRLTAAGQVALAKGNAMDMTVNWSGLQWPLSGKPAYLSKTGKVKLTGTLDNYDLNTRLLWKVVGQTDGKLALNGTGSTKAFDLKSLDISGAPGHITGHAKTQWSPKLDVAAHLEGQHINPGAIVKDVPGDFDLDADVTAQQVGKAIHANVDKLTAHGSLRHQPLDLKAKLAYLGNHVLIDTLHLVSGKATADVSGRFGWVANQPLDGRWSIHSTDLSTIMPGLAGSLQTEGHVNGTVKAPNVVAKLKADNVDAFGNKINRATLDANVDWSGHSQSKVDLLASNIEAGGQKINKVTLNVDGTPAAHTLSLNLDSDIAQADLGLDGHLNKKTYQYRFTMNRLKAAYQKLAPWTLASPASGIVSADAQSLKNACLTSGGARLCITGSHDAKASVGHIKLSNFDYSYAKSFFPQGLGATGAISGTVDARVPTGGSPDVEADLRTMAGRVTMNNVNGKAVRVLDMQPGQISAKMHDNGVKAKVDLPLNSSSGVQAQVDIAPGKSALTEHALSGRVRLSLASLDFIEKLSPEVATFDGNINGDLRLSGTVAKPSVLGNAAINASRIVLVTPGLTLTGVKLAAIGHGTNIGIQAAAKSGGGNLNANGNIALKANGQDVDLTIKGDRFQMANTPEAKAYVSPDLAVKVTPAKVDVTGSVTIPEASITPRNLPASGVTTVSSDQVIVTNKPAAKKAAARAIHADVKVILGKKVRVEAFGLKANLEGALRVVQQPGNVPTGSGAINIVNGSYKAYGQNLDIQKGKILFAGGPVSEPGLDFRAARYPNNNVTVGVQVQGTLTSPQLTLFSKPSMTQSETLSWLLLGRPLNSTNGQQSSVVARAALALGSSKGNQYLQGIGNKVGLDHVGIGAPPGEGGAGKDNGTDNTALTVGKYLSPRLYISYGLGLFNQVSTVSMRYTLSSHWNLETTSSGKSTGGDLIYTIDR